ncbi:glycosyltransferase family 2 protein [Gottfriedia sp. NPDC056225]|uniref:glycosyltransferase family 2 protein n=1 Tax=Gottfriedia sp. NPDC056225 TaxID=3345751 RepID=UPI0035DDF9AD
MEPLVSVIIPIYNTEEHLSKCLDSVLNQTYKRLEVILINDGSKDNSLEICEKYKSADSRIILIDKENAGVSEARNDGVKCSSGDFISFIDSDDWLDNNTFDEMLKIALKTDADIVMSGFYINNEPHMEYSGRYIITNQSETLNLCYKLEKNYSTGVCNKIFKAKSLKQYLYFDKDIAIGEDMITLTNCILNSKKIICYEKPFYHYIRWSGSTVASFSPKMVTCALAHQKVINIIGEKRITKELKYLIELRNSLFCYDYLCKAIKFGYLNRRIITTLQNEIKGNIRKLIDSKVLSGKRKYIIFPLSYSYIFCGFLAFMNKIRIKH